MFQFMKNTNDDEKTTFANISGNIQLPFSFYLIVHLPSAIKSKAQKKSEEATFSFRNFNGKLIVRECFHIKIQKVHRKEWMSVLLRGKWEEILEITEARNSCDS